MEPAGFGFHRDGPTLSLGRVLQALGGTAAIAFASVMANGARGGPHGNYLGLWALAGTLVSAILVAVATVILRRQLAAPTLVFLAILGGLLGLAVVAVWFGAPPQWLVFGGLIFGFGAVVIPLAAIGAGLIWAAFNRGERPTD
jgi:hypothetical protein